MPRSNRPRGSRGRPEDDDSDVSRALWGSSRVEARRSGSWNVQSISASSAAKSYVCPGCGLEVGVGIAHIVAWRADALFGDQTALAERRHWHTHCWKIG